MFDSACCHELTLCCPRSTPTSTAQHPLNVTLTRARKTIQLRVSTSLTCKRVSRVPTSILRSHLCSSSIVRLASLSHTSSLREYSKLARSSPTESSYRTCAIVGGVLTVASLVDSLLFATSRVLKQKRGGNPNGSSGYPGNSKLM
jgi:hypothetical protein